eukprot:TRINITY_DN27122_c0_g1_i1.p1 TRINITY_DN27122_c0_g1~~TRINITY_DN27122_c0_g1_i1.p1  ORF type:complete len:1791 (-),score=286.76 TRINITY_DN27122_c0_g1_i1:25-5397(-)
MASYIASLVILSVLCFCQCSASLGGVSNGIAKTLRGSSQQHDALFENDLRRLAQDANQTLNTTNVTTSETSDKITQAEALGAIFAGIAVLCTVMVHAILAPAKYRLRLLMSVWRLRLKPESFSRWAPTIQWISLGLLILPLVFAALAARQVASELWRVATLGSLVAGMLMVGSLGLARLAVDSFRVSWPAVLMLLLAVAALAGFFYVYIWVVEPFSFIGTSVVLLCLSSVPSILLAFLNGEWQSTRSFLSILTGEKAAAGPPSALPRKTWQRVVLIGMLWLANLGMLGVYGYAVYSLHPDKSFRLVGFVLAAGVAVMDALVWAMWSLGLVNGAKGTAALMVAARVAACVWGERYWLMGHSGVFLAMLCFLAHLVVDLHLPSPDSPAVRRQQLAAEMLKHLKGDVASADESASAAAASPASGMKTKLHCLFHPLWFCALLIGGFTGEVVAVAVRFEVPDISMCSTCAARPQQYYAGVALGAALVYALSLYAVRHAQHKANGRNGPLLELAPLSLVVAYVFWVGVGVYTSWVVDSWSVAIHVSFVPLVAGLFWSGYRRWVEDDYVLRPPEKTKMSVVAPDPASDASIGTSAPAGDVSSDKADPAADAGGVVPVETSEHRTADHDERNCLQKAPWTLRFWILALVVDIAYGATFHGVVDENSRWIGWTAAATLLVLSFTFMSNRLWFGTYRKFPEQPIFWSVILVTLLLWAGLVWVFHLNRAIDYYALALLCVVVLYPAAYLTLLAFQVWRDAEWKPDQGTRAFIRNALIVSALIYVAFLGTIAYWYWAVALCGLSLLGMACILAGALWLYYRNNRFISARVRIIASSAIAFLIIAAASGYTYYFQSIFGGFSIVCGGVACLLMLFWLLYITEAKRRPALERLRVGVSDIGFPIKRLEGGELTASHRDVVVLLAALVVVAVWGLVASAVLSKAPSVGIVVGVLALMCMLVLLSDRISSGGFERAQILSSIPESEVLTAAKDALDGGSGAEPTLSSTTPGDSPGADAGVGADDIRQKLIKALQKFGEKHKLAVNAYQAQVKTSCAGRFHIFPVVSLFQTLNAMIASCRDGKGCVQDHSPEKPHEAQTTLFQAHLDRHQTVVAEQNFVARLQLCLLSAQSQRLWAKESEFRAFLQTISGGSGGLTLEDFKQLPQSDRASIEAAWEKWKLKEAEKEKEEEERRKQEEEAAKKRKEEQRQRLEEARKVLAGAMADGVGDIEEWKALIAQAKYSGLPDLDKALLDAQHKLAGLEKAEALLKEALAVPEDAPGVLKTLQDAVDHASVAGLESVLIREARDMMSRIQGAASAAEEEERKKAEEERRQKLREEQERRRKEEEERRKQEELERRKTGQPKVIAVDIEQLKNEAKESGDGKYTDKVFTQDKMGSKVSSKYEVKRLTDIAGGNVELYVDGWSPGDINQGELGDCWFLSAIACVAQQNKRYLDNLIRFADTEKGLYVVRFYKSGAYRDVAVDDFLPTKYGQCAFASAGTKQEAWVQVLEKAYAKLHGSYDSIEGGFVNDGLVDMTGGIGEQIRLQDSKASLHDGTLWSQLKGLNEDGHLLGCGSSAGSDTDISSMGIVQGHAYSILRVEEIDGNRLMQVRNPWGSTEWKGKWSDGDKASWTQRMKSKLDYVNKDDGAFWIAFEDFVVHFRNIYICRVFNESWNRRFVEGEWKGTSAGGCSNYPTYENNPKIFLQVKGRLRLLLTCEQEDARGVGTGDEEIPLGFRVYKHGPATGKGFAGTSSYAYHREVCVETDVAENSEGPYYIIPTTWEPGTERKFTMKVFWKGDADAVQLYT